MTAKAKPASKVEKRTRRIDKDGHDVVVTDEETKNMVAQEAESAATAAADAAAEVANLTPDPSSGLVIIPAETTAKLEEAKEMLDAAVAGLQETPDVEPDMGDDETPPGEGEAEMKLRKGKKEDGETVEMSLEELTKHVAEVAATTAAQAVVVALKELGVGGEAKKSKYVEISDNDDDDEDNEPRHEFDEFDLVNLESGA